jgi:3alpha(or 20beta)-hydroxysteroid dehydrogenase
VADLTGKVIVVTGAAQGMGRRHVERCVGAGAAVVATDVRAERGRELAASLGEAAAFVPHDVTDEAAWAEVIRTATERFGRIDGLVNNAAIYRGTCPIEDEARDVFEQTLQVNVVGTWLGIKAVIPELRRAGGGSIVNISSIAGMRGLAGFGAYGSSKWAVRGLTKVAAKELADHGIRVNSVHPGGIEGTGMFTGRDPGEGPGPQARTTLQRAGTTDEVSSLVLFLLSDASSYISGVEHGIDGGSTA